MAKAYLVGKLSQDTFPPFLEDVRIASQSATQMAGGMYVDFFNVEGKDFADASANLRKILDMTHISSQFEFAEKMLSMDGKIDAPARNKAVEAAINFAMILRK